MVRGEKAEIHRHADNLRVEGEFTGLVSGKSTEYKKHEQGERASVVKHTDNLKMEGSMAQRSHTTVGTVERSGLVKHQDNLRMEGKMENRQVGEAATRGERFGVIKREDNLKVEGGKFEGRVVSASASGSHTSSAATTNGHVARARSNTNSSIVLGEDGGIKRSPASKMQTSSAGKSSISTSAKATSSSLVLAGGDAEIGSISAVNSSG